MTDYAISGAIDRLASAQKLLADAEAAKARALHDIAKTYKRQVDLQEYEGRA